MLLLCSTCLCSAYLFSHLTQPGAVKRQDPSPRPQTGTEFTPFELALHHGHAKTAEAILLGATNANVDMSGAMSGVFAIFTQAVSK